MATAPQLRKFIPDGNWRDDEQGSGDLARFVDEILQPVLNLLVDEATRWEKQVNPDQAESASVDAMLHDLGNLHEVAYSLSLARRRQLVRVLVESYKTNGTIAGLKAIVLTLTGIVVTEVVAPAQVTTWILGIHKLGDAPPSLVPDPTQTDLAILGASPTFMSYSFQIRVDQALTADERSVITKIVKIVKPAHTHFLGILEPGASTPPDHWELGFSELGTETILHE